MAIENATIMLLRRDPANQLPRLRGSRCSISCASASWVVRSVVAENWRSFDGQMEHESVSSISDGSASIDKCWSERSNARSPAGAAVALMPTAASSRLTMSATRVPVGSFGIERDSSCALDVAAGQQLPGPIGLRISDPVSDSAVASSSAQLAPRVMRGTTPGVPTPCDRLATSSVRSIASEIA